jgi:tetratricopeptide (TPR) repeat protein
LEFNPRFVDALNLLTLCYIQQRNRQQAAATMERVLAMDVRNPIALRYYTVLNPNRVRPEPRGRAASKPSSTNTLADGAKPADTGPFKPVTIRERKSTLFHAVGILSFILGAACVVAFGYFLFVPAIQREHGLAMQQAQRHAESLEGTHTEALAARDETEGRLREEINKLGDEVETWKAQYNQQDRIIRIFLANERFRAGEIEDIRAAVDMLDIISLEGLHIDVITMANAISEDGRPRLANHYAAEGIASLDAGDLDRALVLLEDSRRFITPDNSFFPHVLYHLGTLYYNDPARRAEAIETLAELEGYEGFDGLPASPWNGRRDRIRNMLEDLGA